MIPKTVDIKYRDCDLTVTGCFIESHPQKLYGHGEQEGLPARFEVQEIILHTHDEDGKQIISDITWTIPLWEFNDIEQLCIDEIQNERS